MCLWMLFSLILCTNAHQHFRNFPQVNGRGDSIKINSVVASEDWSLGLWLVKTYHVTWILASDWSMLITLPEYWPLIGPFSGSHRAPWAPEWRKGPGERGFTGLSWKISGDKKNGKLGIEKNRVTQIFWWCRTRDWNQEVGLAWDTLGSQSSQGNIKNWPLIGQ